MDRFILLVDADAYFVAVARLVDPDGAGRAEKLIVGGRPGSRGVVASASYEARRHGVRSGMGVDRALEICPDAMVVPVPRQQCIAISREISSVLEEFSNIVEPASIDEWYLDASGMPETETTAQRRAFAESVQRRVTKKTGISVSVGVASVKVVAKIAVELGKPGGVHVVPAGHEAHFLRRFDLGDIPGVGPRLKAELASRGLVRIEDALPLSQDLLVRWLGNSRGRWLYQRMRGIDPTSVGASDEQKSISREETFAVDLIRDDECERALRELVEDATATLRENGYRAWTVGIKVRESDFTDRNASRTLPAPVESPRAVALAATELFRQIREKHRSRVRLLGVTLSNLTTPGAQAEQIPIFDDAPIDTERDRIIARLQDELRKR